MSTRSRRPGPTPGDNDAPEPSARPVTERIPLGFARPDKPVSEMTDEERGEFAHGYAEAMAGRIREAAEWAGRPVRVRGRAGGAGVSAGTGAGIGTGAKDGRGRRMSGRRMDYDRILLQLQRWARIRVDADGSQDIIGPAVGHSALLRRMLGDGKDPLPLPPPKLHRMPWYALIEERGAVLAAGEVVVSGDSVTIGRDKSWRILETVVPGSSFVVTCPGRAIGRWNLERTDEGDDRRWRLARITVGPGTEWDHHVAHVTRRLARFFDDPETEDFVIVEGGSGYVQACTFGRPFYLDCDLFLRYEAAGDENVDDPETNAPGLGDRLRALGFGDPDEGAEGNYVREGPAPVDARALAEDMLVVLADAYGLTPADPVRVMGGIGRATVSRGSAHQEA